LQQTLVAQSLQRPVHRERVEQVAGRQNPNRRHGLALGRVTFQNGRSQVLDQLLVDGRL
jgi:hypothetical protein